MRGPAETGVEPSRETDAPYFPSPAGGDTESLGGWGHSPGFTELKGLHCRRLPEGSFCIRVFSLTPHPPPKPPEACGDPGDSPPRPALPTSPTPSPTPPCFTPGTKLAVLTPHSRSSREPSLTLPGRWWTLSAPQHLVLGAPVGGTTSSGFILLTIDYSPDYLRLSCRHGGGGQGLRSRRPGPQPQPLLASSQLCDVGEVL